MLEMFKQFAPQLGLTVNDPNYDTSTFKFVPVPICRFRKDGAKRDSTKASPSSPSDAAPAASTTQVVNKTGHKSFRRVSASVVPSSKFTAMDATGKVVWSSGRSTDKGVPINDQGQTLATEFSKTQWQPHWRIITGSNQVQTC